MLAKFIWKDIYSVGIPLIDAQHQDFFATANEIIDLLNTKLNAESTATKAELRAELLKLVEHGNIHFKTEEGYFDRLHYEGAPAHEAAHESYRKRIAHYLEELDQPHADMRRITEEIANYSTYWLSDHILLMDKQYSTFFKEHGVR